MGESENIPTSLIVCAVEPPNDKIIHFNNATNKFEALGKQVKCVFPVPKQSSMHDGCVGVEPVATLKKLNFLISTSKEILY